MLLKHLALLLQLAALLLLVLLELGQLLGLGLLELRALFPRGWRKTRGENKVLVGDVEQSVVTFKRVGVT